MFETCVQSKSSRQKSVFHFLQMELFGLLGATVSFTNIYFSTVPKGFSLLLSFPAFEKGCLSNSIFCKILNKMN